MRKVISSERIPIKMWLDDADQGSLDQAKNLANLPFAFKHIALMPDAHQGYGMPIGGVLATKGVVIPNAVGVDIGCGMMYVCTNKTREQFNPYLNNIVNDIRHAIPTGFNTHKNPIPFIEALKPHTQFMSSVLFKSQKLEDKAGIQLGTLGGGNHFIEIQEDQRGLVGIMIHSGSRYTGKHIADVFNNIARQKNTQWFSGDTVKQDLAFLPLSTMEGVAYMEAMQFCVDYAQLNRKVMLDAIAEIIKRYMEDITWYPTINVPHNYAAMESHFGENVMVHRKGATRARNGEVGIIPGSQGTNSYIVRGLGNQESFMSCSHGAGRVMSRSKAKENLDLEDEKKKMDDLGVLHSMNSVGDLDEAPGAYKDISVVMDNQADLVEIVSELTPMAVIKG